MKKLILKISLIIIKHYSISECIPQGHIIACALSTAIFLLISDGISAITIFLNNQCAFDNRPNLLTVINANAHFILKQNLWLSRVGGLTTRVVCVLYRMCGERSLSQV
jgi:hypothetical protein